MQRRFGYEPDQPLQGSLAICSNQVGQRFDCLSATLEMPWHNPRRPQQERGFDGRRCAGLGAALLDAAAHVRKSLRGVPEPVFPLEDDAYVAPVEDAASQHDGRMLEKSEAGDLRDAKARKQARGLRNGSRLAIAPCA